MNTWTRVLEYGDTQETSQGPMDVFQELIQGDGRASVKVGVGYALQYSAGKVYVEVQVACDQTSAMIETAHDRAFQKAHTLAVEGINTLMERLESRG